MCVRTSGCSRRRSSSHLVLSRSSIFDLAAPPALQNELFAQTQLSIIGRGRKKIKQTKKKNPPRLLIFILTNFIGLFKNNQWFLLQFICSRWRHGSNFPFRFGQGHRMDLWIIWNRNATAVKSCPHCEQFVEGFFFFSLLNDMITVNSPLRDVSAFH